MSMIYANQRERVNLYRQTDRQTYEQSSYDKHLADNYRGDSISVKYRTDTQTGTKCKILIKQRGRYQIAITVT